MLKWPRPQTITELRGFLGLISYYRKFVRNYGVLAQPLTQLLKKGKFQWDDKAKVAFEGLKQGMTTTPTLALPNFSEPFTIETDASGNGIGVFLTQQGQPIAYMSRALGVAKQAWSTYAKEMLAIVVAIQTWRPYLLGHKFLVQTDHRILKHLLSQRIAMLRQQKWISKLFEYDYEIVYKLGKENKVADALSRQDDGPFLDALFVYEHHLWEDIRKETTEHPYMQQISTTVHDQLGGPYQWKNGLLHYKHGVMIPLGSKIIPQLLHVYHDSQLGGY